MRSILCLPKAHKALQTLVFFIFSLFFSFFYQPCVGLYIGISDFENVSI